MARRTGSENDLIKCEYCGELYSVTYKHCPFCNEDGESRWDDPVEEGYEEYEEYDEGEYEDEPRKESAGGKRLAGGGGGRSRSAKGRKPRGRNDVPIGRIIGTVLSLALIVAAVCIVASIVRSVFGGKKDPMPSSDPTPPIVSNAVESPTASEPAVSAIPSVQPTIPAVTIVEPTSFKLNASDLTFDAPGQIYDMKAIFTPADATAPVVSWSSSNPNIAAVSFGGRVTAVGKGTCTITATVEGLGTQSCIFRCNFKDSSSSTTTTQAPSTSTTPSTGTDLTLSRSDFTLAFEGDKWQLKVSGTSSTVTWASSNANVATVSSDGTVVAVGKGTCNVTATVDGVTLKCIVRCSW